MIEQMISVNEPRPNTEASISGNIRRNDFCADSFAKNWR